MWPKLVAAVGLPATSGGDFSSTRTCLVTCPSTNFSVNGLGDEPRDGGMEGGVAGTTGKSL